MSSSIWLYIWKMEAERSLSMVVFTPSSQLKQACFCWTAIITACQFAHYWKCTPVLFIMSRAHGNSTPWFKIAAFLWCCSQNLADYWRAEQFLYIDANFLGSLQGLMKNSRDHVKLKLPLRPWTGNPTKVQYRIEGTETQYYTGGRTGGQTNWKASDAELQCIIDSSTLWEKKKCDRDMVYSPVSIQKGRWLSQLFCDKCTNVLSRCFLGRCDVENFQQC